MFQPSIPQPVPITKYSVILTNHNTAWEFYGIRLTEIRHLVWCLARRFKELEIIYDEQEEQEDHNPTEPSAEMRLMDLLNLAINYLKRAEEHGIRLPRVETPGQDLAIQVGPGVLILAQSIYGVEIPTCEPPDSSYN